jgi:S1-C subfamily serine protease
MKTKLQFLRGILPALLFLFPFLAGYAQTPSDMLENVLSSVITVGVHKTDFAKKTLGFRGASLSEVAYEKALDLAGAVTSGSGFVIEKNGKKYAITNAHVIENALDEEGSIYIYSINRKKYAARVLGGDSFYDIAVLEFIDTPGPEITTVKFKVEEPRLGETVYAIGNPLGEYPYSVSNGIISAKNRVRGSYTGKFGFLQTTATVIWGNSGGPLVDTKGNVAGINSQIAFASTPDGGQIWQSQINFALEAKLSERLVNEIIENDGRILRTYLGLEFGQNYQYESDWFGNWYLVGADSLPVITGVLPDAPSYSTLISYTGSQVTKVNGTEVRSTEEILGEMEKIKPGSPVSLTLIANGLEKNVTVSSKLLTSTELESIARFVLDQNGNIEVNLNDVLPALTPLSTTDFYTYDGYDLYETEESMLNKKYYMVAAGVCGEVLQNMWIIQDLKDFGAAMKLSGLGGVIDIYGIDPESTGEELKMFRQYLSGNDTDVKATLYY